MGVLTVLTGIFCVFAGMVACAMFVHGATRGTDRLVDEWEAMWRPLTRWLPRSMPSTFTTLVIALPALGLAHTLAVVWQRLWP